jgi:hypothetical protein
MPLSSSMIAELECIVGVDHVGHSAGDRRRSTSHCRQPLVPAAVGGRCLGGARVAPTAAPQHLSGAADRAERPRGTRRCAR